MTETLLDQIEAHLRQALAYNENAEVAPAALLWPDRDRQFTEAARRLRTRMPVLTFGELDTSQAQGPAYWLRCVVAGTVDASLPAGTPVVYLPGVGRDDLRAIEGCPRKLAPIAELQYRAQWFSHPSGKDWTVRSLLSNSDRGLGHDVAEDTATSEALGGAFGELLGVPVLRLSWQQIDAGFLRGLLNPDPVGALLEWLDDPNGFRARLKDEQWTAFIAQSKRDYHFDPVGDGEVTGARRLGERQGSWADVWRRYEKNPEAYPGIEARLRKGMPTDQLFAGPTGAWPQDNEVAEDRLRGALSDLRGAPPGTARDRIATLWHEHGERRNWVWARIDRAPLAFALEHLHRLAQLTTRGPSGEVDDLIAAYTADGWRADDAFLAALQAAGEVMADREAVSQAAIAIYWPWLDAHARALQDAIGPLSNAETYNVGQEASTKNGIVTVFVDGLRLDLGRRLADRLGNLDVTVDTTLSALPTVTDTAKPVLTPVPNGSLRAGNDLGPARSDSRAKANITVLRALMGQRGVQVLRGAETGDPSGCAWTETGEIDRRGHEFGIGFVDEIDEELQRIARRVKLLLDAGWEQVDIVTDHGWLLLPGGLEKVELPAATVEVKKGRCARLKAGANVSVSTVPWHWDSDVSIAVAPGVSCFEANQEYEHGGVSLQECIVPRLRVRAVADRVSTGGAAITKLKWLGLMCRIELENIAPGATVDIRARPGEPASSVVEEAKETTGTRRVSLLVPDEDREGEDAYVVVIAADGGILVQREVTIGANR
ncbi:BREX-1 system phosphatase PglZ type B [Phytoactinopolyspora endophytica]|uniref:BREX-1 system phosphatase PglZ type B n=1 Tax=Phytoactinopolyspora endophytica TaxID=1642495 RepID=UPI00101D42DB|nr:BREX-1 system phosphatase PglZ type B [Phytoactinopolyspora endophytica]